MDTLENFENVANNNYINLNESLIIPNDFNDIHFKLLRSVDGDEMQIFSAEESSINYRLLNEFCLEKSYLNKIKLMHKLSTEVSHGLENSGLRKRKREEDNNNNNNKNNNLLATSPNKIDQSNISAMNNMNKTPDHILQHSNLYSNKLSGPCALLLTSKLEKLSNRKRIKILEDAATKYRHLRDSLIRRIKELRQNLANVDCMNIHTNNNSNISHPMNSKHLSSIYNGSYNMEYITRCAYKENLLTKLVMSMDNLFCC